MKRFKSKESIQDYNYFLAKNCHDAVNYQTKETIEFKVYF